MKIYQPMLFVGLGGTGARIGSELERSLRRELCGPDGTDLVDGGKRLPFQLPECLQFVYADFSESDLRQQPQFRVRGAESQAYARTSRVIRDLLPAEFDSSPEVTRMLRIALHEETRSWLPPQARQPRVAPLHDGAGQLPTVGRAALFATMRSGLEPVLRQLRDAISAIGTAAGDLQRVGGGRIRGCDVFVAFSVAGGTGAGIFYDFLHLIGHEFRSAKVRGVKIYPLVVMPSAFPPEAGGGREAELNAARALVDLSRLVDDQNVPDALDEVGDIGQRSRISVHYPGEGVVALRPSTVQTAFLFSKPSVIRPEDLRRSITAMVMSLIGTELGEDTGSGNHGSDDDYQSFAASFVNKSVERSTPARTGIGYRGMSSSLAASLTVPVDDLAEIVAARLLAQAVRGLTEKARRPSTESPELVRELFNRSGIGRLWTREAPDVPDPEELPRGNRAITKALRDRLGDMEDSLARLESQLDREVPRITEEFKPSTGARELLDKIGPFQLEAVLNGLPGHPDRVAREGFTGMLDNRRNIPERPAHVQTASPVIPHIKRSAAGLVPARWTDPDVQDVLAEQQDWYQWRARKLWHSGWEAGEPQWRDALHRIVHDLGELTRALRTHEQDEGRLFADRRRELYRDDRTGITYLLPPQNSLRAFYDDVLDRLAQSERLPENVDAATLLGRLVRAEDWRAALDAVRHSPGAPVKVIKQVVEQRVKRLFGEANEDRYTRPLLPSMELLLRAASGDEAAESKIDVRWLEQFRSGIAGLLPLGFSPDGSGPLKILIVHPASESDARAAEYLGEELNLPAGATHEYRAVDTDSLTVVLFRSGMNLTDISEVRGVLKLWADARDSGGEDDFLHWRQRLGYQDDWLVATEEDRQRILHRLLNAMWNGHIKIQGPADSPELVRIRLQEGESATMSLRLEGFDGGLSSWAGLLRAYERWALLDEGRIIEEFCERLMRALPKGLATTPAAPSPLFVHFVEKVAPRQLVLIEELAAEYGEEDAEWLAPLRHFWEVTYPGALERRFSGAGRATRPTLRALFERHAPNGQSPEPSRVPDPRSAYDPEPGSGYGSESRSSHEREPRSSYDRESGSSSYEREPRPSYSRESGSSYEREPRSSYEREPRPSYDREPGSSYDEREPRSSYESGRRTAYDSEPRAAYDSEPRAAYDSEPRAGYDSERRSGHGSDARSSYDEREPRSSYEREPRPSSEREPASSYDEREPRSPYADREPRQDAHESDPRSSHESARGTRRGTRPAGESGEAPETTRYPWTLDGEEE